MNFNVINKNISCGNIRIIGVAASSVFLVGDTQVILNASIFDTPPESLIVGPIVPLPPEPGD